MVTERSLLWSQGISMNCRGKFRGLVIRLILLESQRYGRALAGMLVIAGYPMRSRTTSSGLMMGSALGSAC